MHELPVTEKILDIIIKHARMNKVNKVVSITLKIGELSDLENEWIQNYFNYLSKGTVAENAVLKIEKVPIVLRCNQCGNPIEVEKKQLGETACPNCSGKGNFSIISGREYYIKEMEAK
jgi:hydrogenase nickel incorporation protein HypA/HybF